MERTGKAVVRCESCEHFKESAKRGVWMCARHLHIAEAGDGCTFGRERK